MGLQDEGIGWVVFTLPVLRVWNPKLGIYDNSVLQQTLRRASNLWLMPVVDTMKMGKCPARSACSCRPSTHPLLLQGTPPNETSMWL